MNAIIELNNVSKKFGTQKVLSNFDLSIEKGDFLALMGKSGAGKSTLLNLIGFLDYPDSGSITVCGVCNPKLNKKNGRNLVRNSISYLFQSFALVENYTAKQNLELQCKVSKIAWSDENLHDLIENFGISKLLSQKVFQLSGGEQQRLALVRTLLKKPEIILADEPTASLDEENKKIVLNALKTANKAGTTIAIVTHSKSVAEYANHTITLEKTH